MNKKIICTTCGTQLATDHPIDACPICLDDRQYIPEAGQGWTSLETLCATHSVIINKLLENIYELKIAPSFAIGQRAILVITPGGNILWDCIALLNGPTIEFIKSKGGLKAIAFSHPHYYTTMNDWSSVFNCDIYIHAKDEQWIFNKGDKIKLWHGDAMDLWDDITLINIGGHFPGSSILHIPFTSTKGAILCGDTFYISPSKKHAAAMYSYPNRIPLPLHETKRIKNRMKELSFDGIFGFYDYQNIHDGGWKLIQESLQRYC